MAYYSEQRFHSFLSELMIPCFFPDSLEIGERECINYTSMKNYINVFPETFNIFTRALLKKKSF